MGFNKKISVKIFYGIFLGTFLVFSVFIVINYLFTKQTVTRLSNKIIERTFRAAYNQLESKILPVLNNAQNTIFQISESATDSVSLCKILSNTLTQFPEIYGCGTEEIVTTNNKKTGFYIGYNTKSSDKKAKIILNKCPKRANITYPDLYKITIQGDTISLNYFYSDNLKSVYLLYDFPLSFFMNALNRESRQLNSRHYLFDHKFSRIKSSYQEIGVASNNEQSDDLDLIKEYFNQGSFGFIVPKKINNKKILFISKLRNTELIVASVMPTDEVFKQLRSFYLVIFILSFISFAFLAYILQRIIVRQTRPLMELSALSRQIEKGKIHIEIPENFNDAETAQLAKTLRTVQSRMQKYVGSLHSTLKEKRALTHDLSIAEKIQNDMLPSSDWSLTNVPQIDIYCKIIPSKGVAGDFYDYFFVDDNHLFFVLGDVSGKGIPAALFMVKALTLMQVEARKGCDPGQIFTAVNEQLTFRNDEGMFVTAVCGIIHKNTGDLILCDAGHHAPLTNFTSDNFTYTTLTKNLPLGMLIGGNPYKTTQFKLKKGDTLILYSDGLPEASDKNDRMLGSEPVEKELLACGNEDVSVLAKKIWNLYERYTQLTTGNDDVSLFLLNYRGENANG